MNVLGQINRESLAKPELDKVTERIIGCAHKVGNTLGAGFVEKVYENAHAHQMRKDGTPASVSILECIKALIPPSIPPPFIFVYLWLPQDTFK